jgi:hypothetical protein
VFAGARPARPWRVCARAAARPWRVCAAPLRASLARSSPRHREPPGFSRRSGLMVTGTGVVLLLRLHCRIRRYGSDPRRSRFALRAAPPVSVGYAAARIPWPPVAGAVLVNFAAQTPADLYRLGERPGGALKRPAPSGRSAAAAPRRRGTRPHARNRRATRRPDRAAHRRAPRRAPARAAAAGPAHLARAGVSMPANRLEPRMLRCILCQHRGGNAADKATGRRRSASCSARSHGHCAPSSCARGVHERDPRGALDRDGDRRDTGDVRLSDDRISRQHVRVESIAAGRLVDLGSRNGGFVDGRTFKVQGPCRAARRHRDPSWR